MVKISSLTSIAHISVWHTSCLNKVFTAR